MIVFAQSVVPGSCLNDGVGLVPCGCDTATYEINTNDEWQRTGDTPDGAVTGPEQCSFNHVIILIQNILEFLIMISLPISAIMFAYAGWLYMSAQGSESQVSKAHSVFKNVTIGFILILSAWVIVWTVSSALLDDIFLQFLNDSS